MFFKNLLNSGWLHALFIAVISYPFASMSQKLVASYTDVNILAYTGIFMLVSAITLLLIAGPGELANATLKRFETWLYAALQITSYILFLYSLQYASATQGATLAMLGGVFIFIISIAFLKQKTNKFEIIGCLIMCVGLYSIIHTADLTLNEKAILSVIIIARGLVFGVQKVITELHKTNRKANSFKSQMRVTGFIMAVASFIYILFLGSIATVKHYNDIAFFDRFPSFSDFVNFDMVLFSLFVGGFVVSTTKYCEFFAGKTIGAKYLISITSLQIIFVYLLESTLSKLGFIEQSLIDKNIIWCLALVLLGNFIISIAGFIKDINFIKKGEKQDTLANIDDNFIENEKDFNLVKLNLANLLNLYDNNSKQLSEDIKIDRIKLDNIGNYDFEDMHIENKFAKKINEFASQHIGTKDKLTKAHNRYYLEHKVTEFFKKDIEFNLYYLDLNKFKPINDEHGHQVGDYVLAETVNKLNNLSEFDDGIFRVGGDEFVLLQTENMSLNLNNKITKKIEEAVNYKDKVLQISTSIGLVSSKNYVNLEDMLKQADMLMFKDKESKGAGR